MSAIAYKVKLTRADDTFVRFFVLRIPIADGITTAVIANYAESLHLMAEPAFTSAALPFNPKYSFFGNKQTQTVDFLINAAAIFGYLDVLDGPSVLPNNGDKIWFDDNHYISFAVRSEGNYTLSFYKNGSAVYTGMWWPTHARCSSSFGAWFIGLESLPWLNDQNRLCALYSDNQCYYSNEAFTLGGVRTVGASAIDLSGNQTALSWWMDLPDPIDEDDPYQDIEDSTPSGPAEGVGIPASDPVDFPSLPSFSATDTGFITLFNPTLAQVKALADYMWNGLFDVNNLRKIFADPMDCILGFNMLPVAIPNSGAKDVCIGNIVSTVSMNLASSQWVEVDCGQMDLGLPYGSYLDFSPYTKYSIYLPYIGTCDLSADDVAGKVLQLKYHVDVLSCSCVAYLKCGDSVLYQWTGSCGYSIPVTQNDFSRMIMAIVSMAAGAVGGAITAGGGLASMAGFAKGGAESAAKNVMGLKPDVHRSGSIGSSAGLMGGQTPYLILEVPKACKPAKQYHYLGYPSFTTVKLGDVSGRQDFENVILDGIPCTEEERDMIAAACEGGVYL